MGFSSLFDKDTAYTWRATDGPIFIDFLKYLLEKFHL
jgi:hypothetical protein